jgi:hypothetical protein
MPTGSFDRGTRFSRPGRKADFCAHRDAPRTENGGEFVDWRPVAYRPHPVDAARQALDIAAGILTGDPSAGTKILEKRLEREELDGSSDSEVLRKSARQLCIATILACDAFQESASTLVAENPAEVAQLLKALCGALPAAVAAYGEALKARKRPRPQDNDGTSEDPLADLIKRIEAASKK